jgi:hypothetical protein
VFKAEPRAVAEHWVEVGEQSDREQRMKAGGWRAEPRVGNRELRESPLAER